MTKVKLDNVLRHNVTYFNDETFIEQIDSTLQIFGRKFPQVTGIFLFDNAPSHKKYPSDSLNAAIMNVSWRQTTGNERYSLEWRDTTNGTV